MWPEEAKEKLEQVFGKGTVEVPLSFTPGKKGIPLTFIGVGSEAAVSRVKQYLDYIGINAIVKPAFSTVSFKSLDRQRLAISFTNDCVETDVNRTLMLAKGVQAQIALAEFDAPKPPEAIAGVRSVHKIGFKIGDAVVSPEDFAKAMDGIHQMGDLFENPAAERVMAERVMLDSLMQRPTGIMFIINEKSGQLGLASPEKTAELTAAWNLKLAERTKLIPNPPKDRMYNPVTKQIELLPPGEVLRRIQAREFDKVGPATFYDQTAREFRELQAGEIKAMKEKARGATINA